MQHNITFHWPLGSRAGFQDHIHVIWPTWWVEFQYCFEIPDFYGAFPVTFIKNVITLKRFLRTRLFYVRNWLNHGKRKKQLCYPTASEKLYYDSKYQTDRICQFQLISNSVCMYLRYFLKGTTPLMMITGKPYRDAASVLNFDLRNRKPTFKISFLLNLWHLNIKVAAW